MNRSLAEYRSAVAVEYATQGMTYQQIADELGYGSRSSAWKAVRRALKNRTVKAVDEYVGLRIAELDMIQERVWARAMQGDISAANTAIRAIQVRSHFIERLFEADPPNVAEAAADTEVTEGVFDFRLD